MAPTTAEQPITPEQLLAMPNSNTLELVDGQIVEKNVSVMSSQTEGLIYHRLRSFVDAHPVAEVYPASLGYRCFPDDPNKVRKPDVSVVRNERLRELPDPDPGFMPIVPDLAVEVVSKNDTVYEIDEKVREYHDAGFPLVWVVDPKLPAIMVHPRGGRLTTLTADDQATAEQALPGFRCRVRDLLPDHDQKDQ